MTGFRFFSALVGMGLLAACGSSGGDGNGMSGGPSIGGSPGGVAGSTPNPTAGMSPGGTSPSGGAGAGNTAGGNSTAGSGTAGNATAGTGGAGTAGSGGNGTAGSGGSAAPTLDFTASKDLHQHTVQTRQAAVDGRLPKIVGKLIVNVEVDNGGIYDYGVTHGFHVLGETMFHCQIPEDAASYAAKGRDFTGNCRWETLDGVDHDPSANVTPADSIMGKVKAHVTELAQKYGEEGWGYFLDAAGEVRWTEVGFTGYSHGGTSAIRWAKKLKVWRAVARSAPRDNICGKYPAGQCPDSVISNWLDEPSMTPAENLYGLDGTQDGEYKDIVFSMERMKFIGALADIKAAAPPYGGSHRLIVPDGSNFGHDPFTDKRYWPAMDVIWQTPPENVTYANSQ